MYRLVHFSDYDLKVSRLRCLPGTLFIKETYIQQLLCKEERQVFNFV